MRLCKLFCLAFSSALILVSGCASQLPTQRHFSDIPVSALLEGSAFGVDIDETSAPVELAGVNDDMRQFLADNVPKNVGDQRKVELILGAILEDGLRLNYNNFKTYTAEEAFYSREGNCMSFTNLFVALAREAGVDVSYQEVAVPPAWVAKGDTWMYNLHINALVDLPGTQQVVDFSLEDYNQEYRRHRLTDKAADARYHNNMGVHWMRENQHSKAFLHFRDALTRAPDSGYYWVNLGSLYRRTGDLASAEASYLIAIELNNEPAGISNLARLYRQIGETELAQAYEARVNLHRMNNPYYLFHIAEEAYAAGDFARSERVLRKAIRMQEGEHEFYRLMGMTQLHLGDVTAARKSFLRAAELAEGPDKDRYDSKLKLLAHS